MHTCAYLELFKLALSLNKQIFQLFQFISAIQRLLNPAERLLICEQILDGYYGGVIWLHMSDNMLTWSHIYICVK